MLQSVPAQVVSQVHVASLLHTCTNQTEIDEVTRGTENRKRAVNKSADTLGDFLEIISIVYPQLTGSYKECCRNETTSVKY